MKISDAHVYPGDGSSYIKTHFRLIVFKPFVGEIIVGRIKKCGEQGLQGSVLLKCIMNNISSVCEVL